MTSQLGAEDLLAFEESVASAFNRGEIRAPVHLYDGNEEQMIEVFQNIKSEEEESIKTKTPVKLCRINVANPNFHR